MRKEIRKLTNPPTFWQSWYGEIFLGMVTGLIIAYGFVWVADNWLR